MQLTLVATSGKWKYALSKTVLVFFVVGGGFFVHFTFRAVYNFAACVTVVILF